MLINGATIINDTVAPLGAASLLVGDRCGNDHYLC
jgi:hypothetical protein